MPNTMFVIKDFCPSCGTVLRPYYRGSMERAETLTARTVYTAVIRQSRNSKLHRKYWALCKQLFDNTEHFKSVEQASDWVKLKVGLVDTIVVDGSRTYIRPRSIAFDKMTEEEFQAFYVPAEALVADTLGCSVEDIRQNIIFEV